MTPQEQLKIYAAYLPYGLQVKHSDYEREIDSICDVISITMDEITIMNSEYEYDCIFDDVRPILYDLSHLTKEIEHEGEKFVPLHKILEAYNFDLSKMDDEYILSFEHSLIEIDMSYKTAQMLLSWHFNIFGIPAGDFIEKATLKKESNEH